MKAPRCEIHIERLRAPGLGNDDRELMRQAVERELARLLANGPTPPAMAARGSAWAPGGTVRVPYMAGPIEIGVRIARYIHASLGGAPDTADAVDAGALARLGGSGKGEQSP